MPYLKFNGVLYCLLFLVTFEVQSQKLQIRCPWKFLYADNEILTADTSEEPKQNFIT